MKIINPFISTLFAGQAFFAFATSADSEPFVIQDQTTLLAFAGPGFCNSADVPPQAYLDKGTFIGICQRGTAQFLGIPYAQPP
jgi:hypothetical protein